MPLPNENSPHLGKIAGPMLGKRLREGVDNLARDGVDLAFETDLLYFDVNTNKIGIRDVAPSKEFRIQGKVLTTDLIVDTKISNDDLEIRSDGSITALSSSLILNAADYIVSSDIRTDDVNIDVNVISSLTSNRTLEIRPTGSLDVYSNVNIDGDLYATGDIELEGNITFGNDDGDSIGFLADVNSDILPDVSGTYSVGRNDRRWSELRSVLINGQELQTGGLFVGDLDPVLRQGKIWYVAQNGLDTNEGDHPNGPFRTIKHALSQATTGETVYIYPGVYDEDLPLIVPVGVTVTGVDIRNVIIQPDTDTQSQDAFLLNGETTVSNLTVRNFYYDSVNDTGYAFRFAPNFKVTTRSPYIQNVTVKTKGSATSSTDPQGFDTGDAGKGALIDGSVATLDTKEASCLFHSCTFITPGVDAITMTNGVRVEWLNSFTYFADRGLYAFRGTGRLTEDGSTLRHGAEIRSIGSANVYGNYGAWADGEDTLMYLINHNFGYIGTGKDENNDPSLRIQANETIELGDGKIYYQSMDHEGDFRVGDVFNIDAQTGFISINGFSTSGESSSITFSNATSETRIDATEVTTGNIRFRDNILSSLSGNVILNSATGIINLTQDVNVYKNLDIVGDTNIEGKLTLGNQSFDIAEFAADIEFDLRPHIDNRYVLGSETKQWNTVFLRSAVFVDNDLEISTNEIQTTASNVDLKFAADGLGRVYVPTNNVEIDQDLTVNTDTTTVNIEIIGLIAQTGNRTNNGNSNILGNIDLTGNFTVAGNAYYQNIDIIDNTISTSDSNSDLELISSGTGRIYVPTNNVEIEQDLTVAQNTLASEIVVTNTATADIFTTGNITISDNLIRTSLSNSDLELTANNLGRVYVPFNNVEITQTLTVNSASYFKDSLITGQIDLIGNNDQIGNSNIVGNVDLNGNLTVAGNAYYQNIDIIDNTISTSDSNSDLELMASGTGTVRLLKPTALTQSLSIQDTTFTSSISNLSTITSDKFSNQIIFLDNNLLTTITTNTNLIFQSSDSIISIPTSDVIVDNNLTVNQTLDLLNTNINSSVTHIGNTTRTGSVNLLGNLTVSNITISNVVQFDDIKIDKNTITTTQSNSDLDLRAVGTGRIYIPTNDALLDQNLTVNGTTYTVNINNSGTVYSDKFLSSKIEIKDNYIQTNSLNNLRLLATDNVILEGVTFNGNEIKTTTVDSNLIFTPDSEKNVILNSNAALLLAKGTSTNRLNLQQADLRFNTLNNLFEGYSSARRTLGGVYSANRNTYINVNSLTNTIAFNISSASALDILSDRIRTNGLLIDNTILFDSNIISNAAGGDLIISPNGTGNTVINSIGIDDSDIGNFSSTSRLTFKSTSDGYLKFTGTAGVAIPYGPTSERPENPDIGDIRFNTDDVSTEVFNGEQYIAITGTGEVATEEIARELGDLWTLILG